MAWSVGIEYIDQCGDVNYDNGMYAFINHDDALDCVSKLNSLDDIINVTCNECSMDDYHEIHDDCIPSIW